MQVYFGERILEEKREQASRAPFRRRFHTDDCLWDSRAGWLEVIENEKVLEVSTSTEAAEVITIRHIPIVQQLRYRLQRHRDSWLIQEVNRWCDSCRGRAGKVDCILCRGNGWITHES